MNSRERVLRTLTWNNPNSLVVEGGFSGATWQKYRESLEPIAASIANDFGYYVPAANRNYDVMSYGYNEGEIYKDPWGCVWECRVGGMQGIISYHPLAESWDLFDSYCPPDPMATQDLGQYDKASFEAAIKDLKAHNKFICCGGERLWERVHFVRGYENAMVDMALEEPKIRQLIDMIADYNIRSVEKYLKYDDVDCIIFQDDWGEQNRLMVSPETWRDYFFEAYKRVFKVVKDAGKYVYFHTDGYLLPVIDDFRKAGVDIINLQSGCNDLDEVKKITQNKMCVSVDIDRQKIMPFGTPSQMKTHIREIYEKFGGAKGGLWVKMDVYPDVPMENIVAMRDIFDELRKDSL